MHAPIRWYIITGEYPPERGGVSDYTRHVAEGLAARGEMVTVLAPRRRHVGVPACEVRAGVRIEWLPGQFSSRGLRAMRTLLNREPLGGRLLVQYVPHAFGWRAMNVALCMWLGAQRRHALWLMVHEVAYPRILGQPWRHALLATVNRWMVCRLAIPAERILVSTISWKRVLEGLCCAAVVAEWAPIPSNFEGQHHLPASPGLTPEGGFLLGHFGTFARWMTDRLEQVVPAVLFHCPDARMLFLGHGSEEFARRLVAAHPGYRDRIRGTGELQPAALTAALQGCDLMIQPFPDGISTRRTSAMCSLALGRPILTQSGEQTEPVWWESGAVRLLTGDDAEDWASTARALLDAPQTLAALGEASARLYRDKFSLEKTLDQLQAFPPTPKSSGSEGH